MLCIVLVTWHFLSYLLPEKEKRLSNKGIIVHSKYMVIIETNIIDGRFITTIDQ